MEALRSRPLASGLTAPVIEVFASIQGEGRYVGEPQVFVRLAGCPLRCRWCDTPGSWALRAGARPRVVTPAGTRREEGRASPLALAAWVAAADPSGRRAVSLTGGEPLVWPEFVLAWRALLSPRRLHLETAGAHPRALALVRDAVDHVSLDLKLPEDMDAPVVLEGAPEDAEPAPTDARAWRAARRACLELVRGRDACAKLVVAGGHAPERFLPLLDDLAEVAPDVPLVLQPVTPANGVRAPAPALLERLVDEALARGLAPRVVPQVHRLLGVP